MQLHNTFIWWIPGFTHPQVVPIQTSMKFFYLLFLCGSKHCFLNTMKARHMSLEWDEGEKMLTAFSILGINFKWTDKIFWKNSCNGLPLPFVWLGVTTRWRNKHIGYKGKEIEQEYFMFVLELTSRLTPMSSNISMSFFPQSKRN